jgi:steroid delta-isomerase-like uncharacterized protein
MSAEENKALVRRFVEKAFNRRNLGAIEEYLASGYVEHNAPPGTEPGRAGLRNSLGAYVAAFPDLQITIEEQVAEGDRVTNRYTTRATHKGDLFGLPPTGKAVTYQTIDVIRVENGRLAERWSVDDLLGLYQQLGVVPAPGQPGA